MEIGNDRIRTFVQKDHEKLRKHFKKRATNPPYDSLPWSSAWIEYVEEMRELEQQLMEAGERL
jgi:hypothetical protein